MSFDKETRNLLAKTVTSCRKKLTGDVTNQLTGVFGLHPDGTALELKKMVHLSSDQTAAAARLRDLLDHCAAGAAGGEAARRETAYRRMTLEISFTILNRLAALRLCEERGLVVECVRQGTASAGFQMFERISGGALGGRYDAYRVFLECLFDELALDLGVLFDRTTPQSAIFPSERCMEDVLGELTKPELAHLWTEDETIGWVYQYFNPPEERKAMRDASAAPRNSRELAVRNQFFTPRYVVEFLTDNTLGRIWYEMRKGDTALKDECRYLVRRPNEVFLAVGEKVPPEAESQTDISQEELLKQIVYIENRPKKDPRDLRILDPACGSGHFLLYAFDLLERIYEEAWGDSESPKSEGAGRTLSEDFETLEDLRREVPKLVMEHNLHGIDIDPRAVQIAALALWLRAQKTWKNLGIKAAERPRVAKSNIVTAEPMPGEEDMRREFTPGLKPRVLGQIVDEVFDKMQLAGEAGSLLKIEEDIKDAVEAAKKQWEEGSKPEQQFLFPAMDAPQPKQQELRFDLKGNTDLLFWERAEDSILEELKKYAERAENGKATRRRFFVEDSARGFGFIDLCSKRYEVVLMNPPFGLLTSKLESAQRDQWGSHANDIYILFILRWIHKLQRGGRVGAITSRSFLLGRDQRDFRPLILGRGKGTLRVLIDLGLRVLDGAEVETCAHIIANEISDHALFYDFRTKERYQLDNLEELIREETPFVRNLNTFFLVDQTPIMYAAKHQVLRAFSNQSCLDPDYGRVTKGLSTCNDERFILLAWEVQSSDIGQRWKFCAKGSDYLWFVSNIHTVIDWKLDGEYIAEFVSQISPNVAQARRSSRHYFKPGATYTYRCDDFSLRAIPQGCIFTNAAPVIIPAEKQSLPVLFAAFFSDEYCELLSYISKKGKYDTGRLKLLPVPYSIDSNLLSDSWSDLTSYFLDLESGLETTPYFTVAYLKILRFDIGLCRRKICRFVQAAGRIPSEQFIEASGRLLSQRYKPLNNVISSGLLYHIGCLYGRWDIRISIDPSTSPKLPTPFDPLPPRPPGMLVGPEGFPAEQDRIVSEEWLRARPDANTPPPEGAVKNPTIPDSEYPLRIAWNGILVDDPGLNDAQLHRDDIIRRVREIFDLLWKEKAQEIEQEACENLGVSNLREYFRKPAKFFQDHLKRYSKSRRKAPIYWPLSTTSGSYTLWLYYHRLTDQTLYAAVNQYVEPKITEVERALARIENELKTTSGREATRLRDRLSEAQTFLRELREFRQELLRVAELPYKPNLNDGVIINAAPFHNLFRLRTWANDTKKVWEKLKKGDYDWAHLAYTIWPDRVGEVCKKDRSIAIAHGLEDLCEVEKPAAKKKSGRGRRKKEKTR